MGSQSLASTGIHTLTCTMGTRVEQHVGAMTIGAQDEELNAGSVQMANSESKALSEEQLTLPPFTSASSVLPSASVSTFICHVLLEGRPYVLKNSTESLKLEPVGSTAEDSQLQTHDFVWDCHVVGRLTVDRARCRIVILLKQFSSGSKTPGTRKRRERRSSALRHAGSHTLRRSQLCIEICRSAAMQTHLQEIVDQLMDQGNELSY